ncbi:MAG TPA: NAD(P)/FAD-dependent oxidoreductase [Patescibacteria group bacterium]|nr:NAD(P)/FAD-dependent oxidoreductase [Patescibacteria group bacterium]
MENTEACKRIVIVGAGFGGLTAAVGLSKRLAWEPGCEIVVIDKNTHHLYRPWLYEVATGDAAEDKLKIGIATPYEDIRMHLAPRHVSVEYQEVMGIDWTARAVELSDGRKLEFDHLVVAVGAEPDFYGIEGLEQHALPMYTLRQALTVHRKLVELVEARRRNEIPFIRVLIGGAGPTGVEFACELSDFMRTQVKKGMLGAGEYSIEMVEASPRPLQAFHADMSAWAKARLEKLGIKLLLDTCIKGAHKDHVVLAPRPLKPGETPDMLLCDFRKEHEKEVTYDLLVWCGGFRANPVVAKLGLATDARGRIEVDEMLRVKGQERVWAVGDCMTLVDPASKRPVPQLAQGAIHQAELVAENVASVRSGAALKPYPFPHMHAVVPMGGSWGIAEVFGVRLKGPLVWFLRLAADTRYFLKTLPFGSAWKLIRAPLTTFRRNNL